MRTWRALAAIVILILIVGASFIALAWRSEIPAIRPSAAGSFDADLVQKGSQLAALGNCIACHTVPGSQAFAGGLAVPTPFGTIYSTNITSDPDTGIGRWSEAAFRRALREGVDRGGRHLYPAFPYDHFTRVTDEDIGALYAYLMTRQPVQATAPDNQLPFPLNFRPILAGWKLLYFDEGPFEPDDNQSAEWNRGAYLAEGLGHCGSCHTPRNALGAEKVDAHFDGGMAEGWNGYAIDENSPAPVPWDRDGLAFYLRNGWHAEHGVSRGPMAEVTGNLGPLPDEDIAAIATYVHSLMGGQTAEGEAVDAIAQELPNKREGGAPAADSQTLPRPDDPQNRAAAIYASACATCHDSGRPPPYGGLDFTKSTAVNAPNPQNIINVTLFGLPAADGEASAIMPGFAGVLSDADMAALLGYMRERFTDKLPWQGVAEMARATRTGEFKISIRPTDGIERSPANVGAED